MKSSLSKLLMLFNKNEKKKLLILFIMMIVAAVFETIGIGAIFPFVGILTDPKVIKEQSILSFLYNFFHFNSINGFIVFAGIALLSIFFIKNIYLLFFNYIQVRVILNQQVRLSRSLFKEYLTKPYVFHLQRNTSELLRNINSEITKVFQGIIISGFQLLTEILVTSFILALLIFTAPLATIIASTLLGGSVFIFFRFFRKKISHLGTEQQIVNAAMIKWVNQGLGASKEVKVSGKEDFFVNAFTAQSQIGARNSRQLGMLNQVPRYFIETIMVTIVLITMLIIVFKGSNTTSLVSTMALFAMAAFRLMPSITRIVGFITAIRYSQPALLTIYDDLFLNKDQHVSSDHLVLEDSSKILGRNERVYTDSIILKDISFRYPNQKDFSVRDVSLKIPIGQSVAFIGESGAGKTTLVDIILGLFHPENGEILIDGKNLNDQRATWKQKIGYIPQSIFLSDDSIRGNIAFGLDENQIDDYAVWRALEQAQLKEFVESLPNQLNTTVGERGVRLSGGQRQRIGIARALYHNPEIIFMDEATSALDNETEKEIMKAIDGLKGEKTLIIIAHRLSTIENCDIVFKLNKGRLVTVDYKLKHSVI
ncbi:ABC transporter ATP-binding protein [Gottfriedia acidiceleris]|uniref:ABC transporter ATP-binding protein/permease n=1 Tax=Gottfriedia acidiceleris TaxID=371036 RepID=A0ABY4JMR1_9BACI|nr:ABC transporter ATP-binding protein [Gottfriedia acidiceleris]UPM54158.1 ABC transporter ATP-binding protein/permease [Gottfriedia acidiceleris]